VSYKTLAFHCFKCDASGFLGDHIVEYYHPDPKTLLREKLTGQKLIKEDRLFYLPPQRVRPGMMAFEYLMTRNDINESVIKFYDMRVGGFDDGKLSFRVVVPNQILDNDKTDIYSARAMHSDMNPKYFISPGADKREIVFNLFRIRPGSPIIVTEGVFSAISAGINGVCTFGKILSNSQGHQILAKNPRTIYMAFDSDAKDQLDKSIAYFISRGHEDVRAIYLPENQDPSDLGHKQFMDFVKSAVRFKRRLYFDIYKYFSNKVTI
jgi:hypothetical protein